MKLEIRVSAFGRALIGRFELRTAQDPIVVKGFTQADFAATLGKLLNGELGGRIGKGYDPGGHTRY